MATTGLLDRLHLLLRPDKEKDITKEKDTSSRGRAPAKVKLRRKAPTPLPLKTMLTTMHEAGRSSTDMPKQIVAGSRPKRAKAKARAKEKAMAAIGNNKAGGRQEDGERSSSGPHAAQPLCRQVC